MFCYCYMCYYHSDDSSLTTIIDYVFVVSLISFLLSLIFHRKILLREENGFHSSTYIIAIMNIIIILYAYGAPEPGKPVLRSLLSLTQMIRSASIQHSPQLPTEHTMLPLRLKTWQHLIDIM